MALHASELFALVICLISHVWKVPVATLLKLTIPSGINITLRVEQVLHSSNWNYNGIAACKHWLDSLGMGEFNRRSCGCCGIGKGRQACNGNVRFNMLVGLGVALVIETTSAYPGPDGLDSMSALWLPVFLLLSLMRPLLVGTWHWFWVPRFWGFCLVGLNILVTAVSLAIASFSG